MLCDNGEKGQHNEYLIDKISDEILVQEAHLQLCSLITQVIDNTFDIVTI